MTGTAGQAERIHRHASRVRRVACERIGAERLHAYCERVKEAFEAYIHGGWGGAMRQSYDSGEMDAEGDDDMESKALEDESEDSTDGYWEEGPSEGKGNDQGESGGDEEGVRGRKKERGEGSVARMEYPDHPPHEGDEGIDGKDGIGGMEGTVAKKALGVMEIKDPFVDTIMDEGGVMDGLKLDEDAQEGMVMVKVDLDDVQEGDEECNQG